MERADRHQVREVRLRALGLTDGWKEEANRAVSVPVAKRIQSITTRARLRQRGVSGACTAMQGNERCARISSSKCHLLASRSLLSTGMSEC